MFKSNILKLLAYTLVLVYIVNCITVAAADVADSSPILYANANQTVNPQVNLSSNTTHQALNSSEYFGKDTQNSIELSVLDSKNPHPFGGLIPILECVDFESDGTVTAYFGFNNPNPSEVTVKTGKYNKFIPEPEVRSQTITFLPGRSFPYPVPAFYVKSSQKNFYWQLNGYQVLVDQNSKQCRKDWVCIYIDVSHPLNIDQQVLARIMAATSIIIGVGENHISLHTSKLSSNITRVVINITRTAENDDSVVDPPASISKLFSDNNIYSHYISLLRGSSRINPVAVRPSSTGLEKIGVELGKPISIFNENKANETNPSSSNVSTSGNSSKGTNDIDGSPDNNSAGTKGTEGSSNNNSIANDSSPTFSNNSSNGGINNNSSSTTFSTPYVASTFPQNTAPPPSVDISSSTLNPNSDDSVTSNSVGTTGTTILASSAASAVYGNLKFLIFSVFANILLQLCI